MVSVHRVGGAALGERLRVARATAGLTQIHVAKALGVARTTLVSIEQGTRQVRPDELVRLAQLYGENLNRLLRPTSRIPDLVLQFRRSQAGPTEDEASIEATKVLQQLAASYVELEERLGLDTVAQHPPEYRVTRGRVADQAEDLAQRIRHSLGVGAQAPIADLATLLESEFGVRIFFRPVASKIGGAFAFHREFGACILVNAKHPRPRQDWTLAHETGHFVTTREAVDVLRYDSHEQGASERFCNRFASALLLPASAMRQRFSEHCGTNGKFSARSLIFLAYSYHVSLEAACRRLEDLQLLPRGTYESLRDKGLNQTVVRDVLGTSAQPTRHPTRFMFLAAEAFFAGLLSEGQVASMLGMDRLDVRALLDGLGEDDLIDANP